MSFLDRIPYQPVIIMAIFLGLAPFIPEPHLWQKAKMLAAGEHFKAIDVFDVFFHLAPILVLIAKFMRDRNTRA